MNGIREIPGSDTYTMLACTHPELPGEAILLGQTDTELFLCIGVMPPGVELEQMLHFETPEDERMMPKLIAFLGFPFDQLDENFPKLVRWQITCLRIMGDNVRRSLDRADVADVETWRRQIEATDKGTLLMAGLTMTDPRAVNN